MNFQTDITSAKNWWSSKTMWLGMHLVAAAPVLEYARDNSTLLHHYIGAADGAVSFALGVLVVWLRKVTSRPIGKPPAGTP